MHENSGSIVTDNTQVRDALAIADALRGQTKALSALSMHQNRIARTFERTVNQLRALQAERRDNEQRDMHRAGQLLQIHEIAVEEASAAGEEPPPPYDPAGDGFVFSINQIEADVYRRQRSREAYSTSF